MPTFDILRGHVDNKQDIQNISGRMNRGTGHVRTKHRSAFTIDGKAAELNGTAGMHLSEGDEVIAVGQRGDDGIFYISGFKNLSSGIIQKGATIIPTLMGLCSIFLGIWTFFLVITPIIFIPLGLMSLWGSYKHMQSNKLLASLS